MSMERLDKLLTLSGLVSRREAKKYIAQGRVSVNGFPALSAEQKFDPDAAEIRLDGEKINCSEFRYFMMNKPEGVLSATEDARGSTVIDLFPKQIQSLGLFPVGRLDKDTTGLLLLTNDGDFSHRVISPKNHVPKRYLARVDGVLDNSDIAGFEEGIVLGDGTKCMSALLEVIEPDLGIVTVYEGKYHQVRRMFASRGKPVLSLHRLSIGELALDSSIIPGGFVELDRDTARKALK